MKYACFISYSHVQSKILDSFISQLQEALTNELSLHIKNAKISIDRTLLQPGSLFNEALAQAICNSACMIVVYSPVYDSHAYCRQEIEGMKLLEQRRRILLKDKWPQDRGMIIPIILRGDLQNLPEDIEAYRQYCSDFRDFNLGDPHICKNKKYRDPIKDITKFIYENFSIFEKADIDPCGICDRFRLPPINEISLWRPKPWDNFPSRESVQ